MSNLSSTAEEGSPSRSTFGETARLLRSLLRTKGHLWLSTLSRLVSLKSLVDSSRMIGITWKLSQNANYRPRPGSAKSESLKVDTRMCFNKLSRWLFWMPWFEDNWAIIVLCKQRSLKSWLMNQIPCQLPIYFLYCPNHICIILTAFY